MDQRIKSLGAWLLRFPLSMFSSYALSPEERGIRRAFKSPLLRKDGSGIVSPMALDAGAGSQRHRRRIEDLGFKYYSLEIEHPFSVASPSPDYVGSIENIPCGKDSFDAVFSIQVLEHVPNPSLALREVARVLKPNGVLLLTTNFMYPRHGVPFDFFRFTPDGLEELCRQAGLKVLSITGIGGTFAVLQFSLESQLQALGRFAVHGRSGNPPRIADKVSLTPTTVLRLTLTLPMLWMLNFCLALLLPAFHLLDYLIGRVSNLTAVGYSLLAEKFSESASSP